ncbi:hypothetical protein QQF64_015990 [Cirrhinus molitorella]|uniref:Uncharacterized protein n=1 Tax=Cirrhinus molitorella TaxID=172907 RepID=A0ABR3LLK4_9TELE
MGSPPGHSTYHTQLNARGGKLHGRERSRAVLGQQGKQHLSCEVMPEASLRLKLKEHVNDCTRGHHHWLDLT